MFSNGKTGEKGPISGREGLLITGKCFSFGNIYGHITMREFVGRWGGGGGGERAYCYCCLFIYRRD